MLYIDPSEMRETSKLEKLTAYMDNHETAADMPDFQYLELPGLEARTGADMMNSPLDGPVPSTRTLLKIHLDVGASLIQIKFDHDLIASIIDGRFKESQCKMIETGAPCWQCVLLFIGFMSLNKQRQLLINNKRPIDIMGGNARSFDDMGIIHYHKSLWQKRGGRFEQILARELLGWLDADLKSTLACQQEPEKLIYSSREPISEEQLVAQKLTMVKGLREILRGIEGLGVKRANAIYQYLDTKNFSRNWYGFHEILQSGKIIEVEGIGEKTMENIKKALRDEG